MKKLLITTALLFAALPCTFDGVTPAVSKAHARIGRPFTPLSFAGVHRRAVRRTFGVGANLGYRGFYHPVTRAAVAGAAVSSAAAYGAGYYGAGYGGGYGYAAPLYDYAGAAPDDYAAADDFAGAAPDDYAGAAPVGYAGAAPVGYAGAAPVGYAGAAPVGYAVAAPVGYAVAAPGWGGGWGWNRPFFGAALRWGGGWGGWGRRWW